MNELDEQNQKYWKWGIIYNNPNDPDIWVQKKVGLGWTFNFAHSQSYHMLGAFLLIVGAIVVFSFMMDRG